MGHRVAPDPLVDRLALEHLALGVGEQLQQLELAAGQVEAVAADEGLELVGADLQLAGDERAGLGVGAAAAAAARDGFDPGHHLLRDGRAWRSSRRRRAAGRAPAGRRSSDRCRRPRRGRAASRRPARGSPSLRRRAPPGRPAARSASSPPAPPAGSRCSHWRSCQPAASARLESTVTKPLSSSMTASRWSAVGSRRTAIVCSREDGRWNKTPAFTGFSQLNCPKLRESRYPSVLQRFSGCSLRQGGAPPKFESHETPLSSPRTAHCPGPFAISGVNQLIAPVAASTRTSTPRAIR